MLAINLLAGVDGFVNEEVGKVGVLGYGVDNHKSLFGCGVIGVDGFGMGFCTALCAQWCLVVPGCCIHAAIGNLV